MTQIIQDNRKVLTDAFNAKMEWDEETRRQVFSPSIKWHVPGNNQMAGKYEGLDAFYGYCLKLNKLSGGTANLDLHDVLASEHHGAYLVRVTAERNGKKLEMRAVWVCHLMKGQVAEVWEIIGDQEEYDDFWS